MTRKPTPDELRAEHYADAFAAHDAITARLIAAFKSADNATVAWLWQRLVKIERDAQMRERTRE